MTRRALLPLVAAAALAAAGCTPSYRQTPVPPEATASRAAVNPPAACGDAGTSYDPLPVAPLTPGSTMARIADRGRIIIGVSSDAVPLAYRNTINGDLEGFEIDLARALARAMFNDETKLELRVIGLDRLQATLDDGDVDLAVRQVGMTCEAWRAERLSAPYATVPVRLLARSNQMPESLGAAADLTTCAEAGSHAAQLAAARSAKLVTDPSITGCRVRFQRGEVDAVAGTNPVLVGLSRQDPYARVTAFDLGTSSLAVAVRADRSDLAAWTNGVLQQRAAGGAWAESWNRWVRPYAGEAAPPRAVGGRPR